MLSWTVYLSSIFLLGWVKNFELLPHLVSNQLKVGSQCQHCISKTCHLGVVPRFSCLLVAIVTCFCWLLHRMGKNKCYPLFKRNFEELVVLSTYQTLHLSCNSFRGRWRQAVTGDHLEPPLDGGQVSSRVDLKGESN